MEIDGEENTVIARRDENLFYTVREHLMQSKENKDI